ncbi:MAG: PqqD family protein [Bacteroidetes bacterium]|nr:PqqD family protein [Bacteroidota bacterium]
MKQKHQINSLTILQRNPEQLFTLIDNEVVMLNIRHEEYLNLNLHASYIWQQLDRPRSFGELTDFLCSEYDVDMKVCIEDTLDFIIELVEKGIIQIRHDKTS